MVATVGSISIDLSTNTAKFTQGFKASASTVEQQSKRMSNAVNGFAAASKRASSVMSGFVGGIVAGGALAAIGSLSSALGKARQSLSDFEEIGNRAKATGLSTDTFQAISHGASLADVEQESLNKSLEIFARNAGLAKEGIGTLYSGLIKLNPQLLQSVLHATSQEERLKLVADAMAQMTDATDKAALATAVFGRGGAEMVRVLDKGSASIEEMKRQAADLGIIIPEDLIARSGELDDKLTLLAKVIDVNISEALVKAAPLLVAAAEGMVKLAKGANAVSDAYDTFMKVLHPEQVAVLNKELYDTQVQMKEVGDEVKAAEAKLAELLKHKDEPGGMFDVVESQKDLAGLRKQLDDLDAHAKDIKVTMDTSQAKAAMDQLRDSDLPALWADAAGGGGAGGLPRVHHGVDTAGSGNAIDPETGEKIERAIEKETEATNRVAARAADVYRGVGTLDTHTAGYFDKLGSRIGSSLGEAARAIANPNNVALQYTVPANSGYATGGAASSYRYSGNSSSGSWAGKQMSFGGGGAAASAYYNAAFGGRANRVGGAEDASTITSGGTTSGAINVNIVVKPVMEGTRLSGQSAAEIKQAAAAGANTALRAYYGR
jgi:hypothetical protein